MVWEREENRPLHSLHGLKTNVDNETCAQLVVPLEVQVVSRENIISAAQELDSLGLIRLTDNSKQ